MQQKTLMNFRIPVRTKQALQDHCRDTNVSMTAYLNILIADFLGQSGNPGRTGTRRKKITPAEVDDSWRDELLRP